MITVSHHWSWYQEMLYNFSIHLHPGLLHLRRSSRLIHFRVGMDASQYTPSTSNIPVDAFLSDASVTQWTCKYRQV